MPPRMEDFTKFANATKVAYIATVESGRPRVRAFDMWKADNNGFYFHNNKKEGIHKLVQTKSNVQLFFGPGPNGRTLRVEGALEFVDDKAVVNEFYNSVGKAKFMNRGAINPVIFRMAHGDAWFNPQRGPEWKKIEGYWEQEHLRF